MFVHVLRRIVGCKAAVDRARADHRSFEGEVDEAFEDAGRLSKRSKASAASSARFTIAWPLPS